MYYDENDICKKCGKKLESNIVEYDYVHDMGFYSDSYKKVNRNFAKKVGLDFYCNDCYDNMGDSKIAEILESASKFLEHNLQDAIDDVTNHYEEKTEQLINT